MTPKTIKKTRIILRKVKKENQASAPTPNKDQVVVPQEATIVKAATQFLIIKQNQLNSNRRIFIRSLQIVIKTIILKELRFNMKIMPNRHNLNSKTHIRIQILDRISKIMYRVRWLVEINS